MKIFRIIGNEGRITIPYSIRQAVGFLPDDVVFFQLMDADSVLVRREVLHEKEKTASVSKPDTNLIEYLEGADNCHDKHEKGRRLQHRKCDVAELLPFICTIEHGCLIIAVRNSLQS